MSAQPMPLPRAMSIGAILAAFLLAVAMLGASARTALAGPESGVDLAVHVGDTEEAATGDPPTVCAFHVHFLADTAVEGTWELRSDTRNGSMVATGVYDTTGGDSRAPATGAFEVADGTYYMTWDDELEVDRSFDFQEIVVACPGEQPTGSELPVSPGPTGGELPVESTNPGGGELPAGGVRGVTATPPSTDGTAALAPAEANLAPALAILFGVSFVALGWALRTRGRATARRVRRS